ncbi:hypothetical protein Goari_026366, partial [Gossypium aridum]|nr:hypothetical protein [Gossypium aridum]
VFPDDIQNSDNHYRNIQKFFCQLNKAIQEYHENILDPTKWSQDYPWYYSQINIDKIRIQDSQLQHEDKDEDFDPDARYDAIQLEIYQKKQEKYDRIIDLDLTSDESTDYN